MYYLQLNPFLLCRSKQDQPKGKLLQIRFRIKQQKANKGKLHKKTLHQ